METTTTPNHSAAQRSGPPRGRNRGPRNFENRSQDSRPPRQNSGSNPNPAQEPDQAADNVKNLAYVFWYFLVGCEAIYHFAKGLYLTAYFNLYEPFMQLISDESKRMYFGQALFNGEEWTWHFKYGLRGPAMLFTAWLLYRYLVSMKPWERFQKNNQRGGHRRNFNRR